MLLLVQLYPMNLLYLSFQKYQMNRLNLMYQSFQKYH